MLTGLDFVGAHTVRSHPTIVITSQPVTLIVIKQIPTVCRSCFIQSRFQPATSPRQCPRVGTLLRPERLAAREPGTLPRSRTVDLRGDPTTSTPRSTNCSSVVSGLQLSPMPVGRASLSQRSALGRGGASLCSCDFTEQISWLVVDAGKYIPTEDLEEAGGYAHVTLWGADQDGQRSLTSDSPDTSVLERLREVLDYVSSMHNTCSTSPSTDP